MHLMQGPITVFDANAYAGDARMEDLAAGQERLISYALDIKTEVEPQAKGGPTELMAVALRKGTLLITRKMGEDKEYVIRNRDQKKKMVLVEHPLRAGWDLMTPKEPNERARDVYRFAVEVAPGKTEKLLVKEESRRSESVEMTNVGSNMIGFYIRAQQVSPAVKVALQKIVVLRDRLDEIVADKTRLEKRVSEIGEEQGRIRENMNRLSQTSELYQRYVTKLDQQETELEGLRQRIESARDRESKQRQELNDFLLNLDVA
jgi:chromosome segregation ATPase